MNKKLFYTAFLCCLALGFEAKADIKFDIGGLAQKVMGAIQAPIDSALKKVNTAAEEYKTQLTGSEIVVTAEKAKAYVEELKDSVQPGGELYESSIGKYEDAASEVKKNIKVSPKALENQLGDWKKGFDEYVGNKVTEIKSKLSAAKKNQDTLQSLCDASDGEEKENYLAQLASVKSEAQNYEAELADMIKGEGKILENDPTYQALKEEGKGLQNKIDEFVASAKQKLEGLGAQFIQKLTKRSKSQNKASYDAAINDYFIAPNDPVNEKNVEKVSKARRIKYKKDIANAFVQVWKYRQSTAQIEKNLDRHSNDGTKADTAINGQAFGENAMMIDDIKRIQDDVILEIAAMRLQASKDLMKQGYRINNPAKDSSEYNFDQYRLTEDDIEKGRRS